MAAEITFNQPTGAGAGTAGKARNDIWLDQVVNMVSSGTGTTYEWELLSAPPGSAATVVNPTLSTANITPDVMGTYRIRLTVDGGGTGNIVTKVIRARYDSTGVIYKRGWALPAVDEEQGEADYGTNTRHWDEVWQEVIPDVRGSLTKTLVFQPGGTAEGNTFTDWSLLMVAFGETAGEVTIVLDGTSTIPTGTWNLERRATIVGSSTSTTILYLTTGASLLNPRGLKYLRVNGTSTYQGKIWLFYDCYISNCRFSSTLTSVPVLQTSSTNGAPSIWMYDSTVINGAGGSASSVWSCQASTNVYVEGFSTIEQDVLGGSSNWYIYLENSVSTASSTQTNCSGTVTVTAPSAGGITTTFVFRPFGVAADNVYTDWTLLMADHSATEGPKIIEFADFCSIPSGTYDMSNTILRGEWRAFSLVHTVRMEDGAVFQDAKVIEGGLTIESQSSSPVLTFSDKGGGTQMILRDTARLSTGNWSPTSPLISISSGLLTIHMYGQSQLYAPSGGQPVATCGAGGGVVVKMYDDAFIGWANSSFGEALTPGAGYVEVDILSQGATLYHTPPVSNYTVSRYCVRQYVVDLVKGLGTNASATPAAVGACYLSLERIPVNALASCKFRAVLETTNASVGYEAYVDLFDVSGQLNAGSPGTPQVLPSSQIDTGSGSVPTGAPTPNPLIPSVYEVDLTAAIIGGTWVSDIAVLEARLWIGTAAGGNAATCKSAELVFEW